jgi:hypothetical protein
MESGLAFQIAEYTALRQELSENAKSAQNAFTYSSTANALIASWLIVNIGEPGSKTNILALGSLLPAFVTLNAWLLFYVRRERVSRIGEYCGLLENKLSLEGLGWERFRTNIRNKRPARLLSSRLVFNLLFMFQMALSLYLAYYVMILTQSWQP